MRRGLLAIGLLLSGCSTISVDGTIDGLPVPFEVSMFVEQPDALGSDDAMRVVFSSLPNACRVYGYYMDRVGDGVPWRKQAIFWQEIFPVDFWELSFTMRATTLDATIVDGVFNGTSWDQGLQDPGWMKGTLRHYVRHPDPDEPNADDWYVEYGSNSGAMALDKYTPGEWVEGAFSGGFVDDEGVSKGELGIRYSAMLCPDLQGFY